MFIKSLHFPYYTPTKNRGGVKKGYFLQNKDKTP